jgi:hypothetical protein
LRDAGLNEGLLDVSPHAGLPRGRLRVEREVAALRADDQLFAREAGGRESLESLAHRAFAALEAVVGGRVDDVRAQLDGARDGVGV